MKKILMGVLSLAFMFTAVFFSACGEAPIVWTSVFSGVDQAKIISISHDEIVITDQVILQEFYNELDALTMRKSGALAAGAKITEGYKVVVKYYTKSQNKEETFDIIWQCIEHGKSKSYRISAHGLSAANQSKTVLSKYFIT
ncbi:MAG: hypothetical protein LBN07_01265 [Christensenellaceae bacterium]|jgi:hypothetical protein|nr:hypothetical protein [Christensenellaceae bacterium]